MAGRYNSTDLGAPTALVLLHCTQCRFFLRFILCSSLSGEMHYHHYPFALSIYICLSVYLYLMSDFSFFVHRTLAYDAARRLSALISCLHGVRDSCLS